MKNIYLIFVLILCPLLAEAQSPGDTIRVKALDFETTSRDVLVNFPDISGLTFEKILLKYTMRCKDGLVSTGTDRNLGCGEWDYSCNTYLVDSTHVEAVVSSVQSHLITDYDQLSFPYKETPVYDYLRATQYAVELNSTINESVATLGAGNESLDRTLATDHVAGRSYYMYTSDELLAAGLTAGELDGLAFQVLAHAGEASFLKIRMKNTTETSLAGVVTATDFTEVYYNSASLLPNAENRFQFYSPFMWDGSSNIIVEFSFTNNNVSLSQTVVQGEMTSSNLGLSATNEQEIIITNNAYIECNDYAGLAGSQNRTVEAWIKTTNGSNGEILAYGTQTTGSKWTFRLAEGLLRLEVHGGGTVSSSRVDDGEWHHVACVLNGSSLENISFYIDGVLDSNSTTGTTAISSNTNTSYNVRISRGVNNRYLDATIDEVRFWDTALTIETINEWKNLKVTADHPNYNNLELYYEFNEEGNQVIDSSPKGRDATIIGERFNLSEISGPELFKDFIPSNNRPNLIFYQGEYDMIVTPSEIDRPIAKSPRHLVLSRSIETADPNYASDDKIINDGPVEYWTPQENIYNEATGELIETNDLNPDGVIDITNLTYTKRFPFYNELVSFVTPYGIGLDLGLEGASWTFDMSDYVSILRGDKRLLMTLGGQNQEEMDLEFMFIVGTPPRDVIKYEQVWQGTNRIGNARIGDIIEDIKFAPKAISTPAEASSFKLKSTITGHGSEGEFAQNGGLIQHRVSLDQNLVLSYPITQECSFNPIFPQGGTWVIDRQGWCPGERSLLTETDISPLVNPGEDLLIDYNTTTPQVASGDYRYHVSHQLVAYGEPNFTLDAAIVQVRAPNNTAEFTRVGNICADPIVVIRNTGADPLTSLTINYWINGAATPQSYDWTGNLDFMEEEEVVIPANPALWYDILAENNIFYVSLSSPNMGSDQYTQNNAMSASFDYPKIVPNGITIQFRTNNAPTENSYQLLNANGEVVGANNLSSANNTYNDDYDLPNGCYTLRVFDSGGDGVDWWANAAQGTGSIKILDAAGATLELLEPDFGGGFDYSFSTSFPVSSEDLEFLTSIELFPNPADDLITIKLDTPEEAHIYITDISGRAILSIPTNKYQESINLDVSSLNTGLYLVVIEKGELLTTRKIVVK